MRWKLHTHFGKSWYNQPNYFQYNIDLLPSVELSYCSMMCDEPETSQLRVQWLIWYFAIWFTKEVE